MQRLAYGTRLVLTAQGVPQERLRGAAGRSAIRELAALWPLGGGVRELEAAEEGPSWAAASSQGYLMAHAFPARGGLVLVAFAVGEAPTARFLERAEQAFEMGVYELQRSRYGALLPQDPAGLERALLGERFVARARLVPSVG